ncbi:MAG: WYL domain-containing protein, partial [Flavobacteriales bacterium]
MPVPLSCCAEPPSNFSVAFTVPLLLNSGPAYGIPLGLVLKAGVWYLVARPAGTTEGGQRTYRVSNIRAATALATPVRRPARF